MRKKLLGITFQAGLRLNATLTRLPLLRAVEGRLLTPMFVRLTRAIRGAPVPAAADTLEGIGREWERLLGNRVYARVTAVDPDSQTVYGEISGRCPLRHSGDLAACHRLMAYDRGLMAPYGVSFVVLASQAEHGRSSCRIAMRPGDLSTRDLVPAHRLVGRSNAVPSGAAQSARPPSWAAPASPASASAAAASSEPAASRAPGSSGRPAS